MSYHSLISPTRAESSGQFATRRPSTWREASGRGGAFRGVHRRVPVAGGAGAPISGDTTLSPSKMIDTRKPIVLHSGHWIG